MSLHDAWIAAYALRHGVPLVTRNAKDFKDVSALDVITEHMQSQKIMERKVKA